MGTKICYKCNVEKSITEYHKNLDRKDGLNNWCKKCKLLSVKIYYKNNIEKRKKYVFVNTQRIKKHKKE